MASGAQPPREILPPPLRLHYFPSRSWLFLRYVSRVEYRGEFTVLPLNLDPQLYAFAVREGSALREPINRVLLRKIHEPAWHDLL